MDKATQTATFMMNVSRSRVSYELSNGRTVRLTNTMVVFEDEITDKYAAVNFQKFVKVMAARDEIDAAVEQIRAFEEIDMKHHVGGNWFVSVGSGVLCVDLRKWFFDERGDLRPGRIGMGLRLYDWQQLKEHYPKMLEARPDLAATVPCFDQTGHKAGKNQFNLIDDSQNKISMWSEEKSRYALSMGKAGIR
jgi:Transcriptional Coactivator p15 (PC4)